MLEILLGKCSVKSMIENNPNKNNHISPPHKFLSLFSIKIVVNVRTQAVVGMKDV